MKLTVIGLGLIGGSMAIDLRKARFTQEITGVDANPENAHEALRLGIIDRIDSLEGAVEKADMVIIAIPVDKVLNTLTTVLDLISDQTTVIDVGSTKKLIAQAVENHPKRRNYVAAHPMSGTENSGPTAALEGLFEGKINIICDQEKCGPQHLAFAEKVFQVLGMDIAYMTSDEQDHSTAFISHLPHAAAFALANAVLDKEDREIIFDLASGGFNSTVRLAKSSPEMWGPIFQQNKQYIVESLDVYIKHLKAFRKSIESDPQEMMALMKNANRIRGILAGDSDSLVKNEKTIVKLYTK
ncbi:prephenate and/or arogenate dehydrogenase [Aquipluma nitroreducens]|uniref:Prephenate and/or arogenate dehydrogenase n=1 Tax=Aquipluma nitroreducens TaxID=2010828 RepID=A0A5K7SA41_9BACT|nr:prephenate dehydrogenase [Aquipluma nitroreducens]BBE18154.1 prephenate and/or arogenate dehydrogenase [Aquipluma nitroreducens]